MKLIEMDTFEAAYMHFLVASYYGMYVIPYVGVKIGLVAQVFKFTIHKFPGNGGGRVVQKITI